MRPLRSGTRWHYRCISPTARDTVASFLNKAFIQAVKRGCREAALICLRYGVHVNRWHDDDRAKTPLMLAVGGDNLAGYVPITGGGDPVFSLTAGIGL